MYNNFLGGSGSGNLWPETGAKLEVPVEKLGKKDDCQCCPRLLLEKKRPHTASHSAGRVSEFAAPERLKSAVDYTESAQFVTRPARKLSGHEPLILNQLEVQIIPKFIIMH